jgi:hypothetical protein
VARRLGEDADRVADQRSLAELNYVHSNLNTVHLSRTAFREGMEPEADLGGVPGAPTVKQTGLLDLPGELGVLTPPARR